MQSSNMQNSTLHRGAITPHGAPSPTGEGWGGATGRASGRSLSGALYFSGQPIASTRANAIPSVATALYNSDLLEAAAEPSSYNNGALLKSYNLPAVTHERHHRPIKIGVSVAFALSRRWSLQTGLTYSRLNSTFEHESPTALRHTNQQLHYVGIPVSASYSMWQGHGINVYVKGGAAIEKLVKGKATTTQTYGPTTYEPKTETIKENRPVMSTHAAAGVEYAPIKGLSIFAEPGAELYFNNGSGLRSSYTDKPLNFNLNIGLRFSVK